MIKERFHEIAIAYTVNYGSISKNLLYIVKALFINNKTKKDKLIYVLNIPCTVNR